MRSEILFADVRHHLAAWMQRYTTYVCQQHTRGTPTEKSLDWNAIHDHWLRSFLVVLRAREDQADWQKFVRDYLNAECRDTPAQKRLRRVLRHLKQALRQSHLDSSELQEITSYLDNELTLAINLETSASVSSTCPAAVSHSDAPGDSIPANASPHVPERLPEHTVPTNNFAPLPATMSRSVPLESPAMSLDSTTTLASSPSATQGVEQFYGLIEQAPLAALLVDPQGKVKYINAAGQSLLHDLSATLGFGSEELVGNAFSRLQQAVPSLKKVTAHEALVVPVGEAQLEVTQRVVLNDDGRPVGSAYYFNNVTAIAELQAKYVDASEKLGAVDRTNAVIEFQLDGTIVNANENFLSALGYTLREIQGKHHSMFVDDAYRATSDYREFWAKLNRGEHHTGEFKRIAKGGREIWIRAIYSPIRDAQGKLVKVVKFATDVTAELKAREEATRIQNMMDNLPINVVFAGRDSKISYVNPSALRTLKKIEHLLPVPAEQLKGQSYDILHKSPEMQRRLLADPRNLPHKARIKIGPETLDLLVSAITDAKGEYIGPMVTWSIISDQVKMADDFERDVKGVVQIVTSAATEMQASSKNLAAASEETARQSQVVAAASEEATRNVETVSSSAEQLSKSITEIARHVQDASKMTSMAVTEADKTNVTIKQLGDSSNEIGQVVKVITSIAQQTNLLALNATIEAARAGEAGKGFAVVANEVKELARQTAKATEEISQKISAIQSSTGVAITAIGTISESIRKINEISTTIASAVEEQTAATNEISRNVSEAARGTAEVSSNIAGVSQAADEGGRGASDILVAAEGLAQESVRLDQVTNDFLKRMRSL
ncbi:PAS domain S-box protein [bacterium]|nr:PAS domain S-box protein [bacterium]